uniref:YdcH family protein n=1 Tax=Aliarcobacter sp. TaxID=2321116 RepID=UPI0040472136
MFHEYRDLITELKQKDAHFHKLFERHNELDDIIVKLEESHADQFEIETNKKEKLKLKDEIYSMIIKYKNKK